MQSKGVENRDVGTLRPPKAESVTPCGLPTPFGSTDGGGFGPSVAGHALAISISEVLELERDPEVVRLKGRDRRLQLVPLF